MPQGLLVYASGQRDPGVHEIVHVGKELSIVALDLTGSPEEILGEVSRLAERIKSMKSHAQERAA